MTIALRVAGTAVTNTTNPNPSFGAGILSTDINVLWVAAKPIFGVAPSGVVITTPTNWSKIGQFVSGSTSPISPPGNTGSVLVAVYVRVGSFSGALGAISITNCSVAAAVINSYSTTAGVGWEYSQVTYGRDEAGTSYDSNITLASTNISVTTGDFLLSGTAVNTASTMASPSLTATGATLTQTTQQNVTSNIASPNANLGMWIRDGAVTAGTSTAGPRLTDTANTNGVSVFIRLRESGSAVGSTESVAIVDKTSGVPSTRTWENGKIVTAADLNFQVRDSFNWLMGSTRPGVSLRNTSPVVYAASAETKLLWNVADVTSGDISWYPGESVVVVREPGFYVGQVTISAEDTGTMNQNWVFIAKLYIFRGQTNIETILNQSPDMPTEQSFVIGGFPISAYLRAGDYVEVRVSGGWSAGGAQSWTLQTDTHPRLDLWWASRWELG